jgi:hypothetical protein
MTTAPRPRTFEEMTVRLERMESNLDLVRESVHSLAEQIGALAMEMSRMRAVRERETSWHDLDPELAELQRTLKDRVKDPTDQRFNSERARAMVQTAIKSAKRDDQADRWNSLVKVGVSIVIGIAIAVVGWLLGRLR